MQKHPRDTPQTLHVSLFKAMAAQLEEDLVKFVKKGDQESMTKVHGPVHN